VFIGTFILVITKTADSRSSCSCILITRHSSLVIKFCVYNPNINATIGINIIKYIYIILEIFS